MASKKNRAPELDFLRGFALFMMILMHLAYDLRYEFGLNIFGFLTANWFWAFVHPFFIVIFVGVSGVCSSFSRNNFFRGIKLLAVAAGLTLATWLVTKYAGINCLIIFNVLALLAVSILFYSLIQFIEKKTSVKPATVSLLLGFLGTYMTAVGSTIRWMDYSTSNPVFLPVGFAVQNAPSVADAMEIFPWMGVFLLGCVIGRVFYSKKESMLPASAEKLHPVLAPVEFIGRHSLIIYLVHQPVVYGILYVIFLALGKIK